jgi:putative SOS response-associated peptidase YedK
MINRYSLTGSSQELSTRFGVEVPNFYKPRYNAAPTQLLPVILSSGVKGISWFYWGRPAEFANNKPLGEKIINLHTETLQERPVLKKALLKHRCIIPADGWYGWRKIGKRTMVPHRFTTLNKQLFSFAGLWEEFENESGEKVHSFTILTNPSVAEAKSYTERIPAILTKENEIVWLNEKAHEQELFSVLTPYQENLLSIYPVSPRINDTTVDHASLIIPVQASDQHGNFTLFD